jgi:hypothetical protein
MKNEPKRLIRETNPISSRTAFLGDDGYFVWLAFLPHSRPSFPPVGTVELSDRLLAVKSRLSERTILYRRPTSPLDWARSTLRGENPHSIAHIPNAPRQDEPELVEAMAKVAESIRPLSAPENLAIKLIWSQSGESVAAVLNGEPWAFIDGGTQLAYSKGVLGTAFGKPWDEALFKNVFHEGAGSS